MRLRPVSELPSRAKLFLVVADLVIIAFVAWFAVRVLGSDGLALAVLLIVLGVIGALAVAVAIMTVVRGLFSLRALPFVLGRGMRRLLFHR